MSVAVYIVRCMKRIYSRYLADFPGKSCQLLEHEHGTSVTEQNDLTENS